METSAIVGSEVRASAILGAEANAIVGTEESRANVGHGARMADSKTKSNIMRSGKGGKRWRSKIGMHNVERKRMLAARF